METRCAVRPFECRAHCDRVAVRPSQAPCDPSHHTCPCRRLTELALVSKRFARLCCSPELVREVKLFQQDGTTWQQRAAGTPALAGERWPRQPCAAFGAHSAQRAAVGITRHHHHCARLHPGVRAWPAHPAAGRRGSLGWRRRNSTLGGCERPGLSSDAHWHAARRAAAGGAAARADAAGGVVADKRPRQPGAQPAPAPHRH